MDWIDSSIRRFIRDKNEAYKRFKRSNNKSQHFENFQSLQNLLGVSIEASKQIYCSRLSKSLMDPSTSSKTYWSVLITRQKKHCIPPIFHENRFFTNFKEKAKLFIFFFLSNIQLFITIVKFHLSYISKLINLYQISFVVKGYRKCYTKFRFK